MAAALLAAAMACAGVAKHQRMPADRAGPAVAGAIMHLLVQTLLILVMEEGRTLSDCNIQKEHIQLCYAKVLLIIIGFLEFWFESCEHLKAGSTLSASSQKEYTLHLMFRLRGGRQIFVKTTFEGGRTLSEHNIQKEHFTSLGLFILFIFCLIFEGKQLKDDRTLSAYDMQEKSICIQTFVKTLADEAITLDVGAVDLIDKGKTSVPDKEGIPPVCQCLIFGNKQLEDDRTLLEHDVQKETSIHLRLCLRTGMQIYAKTLACKTITFEAEASDTFDSVLDEYALHLLPDLRVGMQLFVQNLICKTITTRDKEANPPAHQCLRIAGKQSEDGRALSKYNIQKEAALPLVLRLREYRLIF